MLLFDGPCDADEKPPITRARITAATEDGNDPTHNSSLSGGPC